VTTLSNVAFRSLLAIAVAGLPIIACQGPEPFYREGFEQGSGGPLGSGGSGAGGVTSSGGSSGSGGMTGAGGVGGATGTGGSGSTGTGPCAGFCSNPAVLTAQAASGNNMTPGACYSTTASIQGAECTGATGFMVDGMLVKCTGAAIPLPAKIMGGYCFQFATTDPPYAGFSTY
jgi:hypothetical protein